MKLTNAWSIVLIPLLGVFAPAANAHNQAKYTNIPFVVPYVCTNIFPANSSRFVTAGGALKLQVIANVDSGAGALIFDSFPGTPGRSTIANSASTSLPQTTLTFNVSGQSSLEQIGVYVEYADLSSGFANLTNSNGFITAPLNFSMTPGSPITQLTIASFTSSPLLFSNFSLGNQPVLPDTTLTLTTCEM